jgi:MFS family permease
MPAPTFVTPRALIVICLGSVLWAFSFGLGAPLASLWLHDAGFDYEVVGFNTGIYYLGIALTAGLVPRLMVRWGPGCIVAGCLISGLTVAVFPWADSLAAYHGVRLLNGVAGAMTLIPLETYINRDSPPAHRSRNFGYYALAIAVGWALGNLVGLQMYDDFSSPKGGDRPSFEPWSSTFSPEFLKGLPFVVGGAAAVLAGVVVWAWLPRLVSAEENSPARVPLHPGRNFLSFGTAWCQGFLEGGMVAFLSLYLLAKGLDLDRVSWLTSSIMIGVILFQVPVAWFADRLGRTRVLLGCYAVVIAGLTLLPWCGDSAWLALWLFLVGACSGAFYPLGLAILGERIPSTGLARANAWFLAINCLGSLTGPDVMGVMMDWWGNEALLYTGLASVVLVLGGWFTWRFSAALRRRMAGPGGGDPANRDNRQAA